jgi:hypothetical protein
VFAKKQKQKVESAPYCNMKMSLTNENQKIRAERWMPRACGLIAGSPKMALEA